MSNSFRPISQDYFNEEVTKILCPKIASILACRGPGHCMRVADLDDAIIECICKELRKLGISNNFYILGTHDDEHQPFRITSTKLVELRNEETNGQLGPPLLVFVPAMLRTSAEDSFGVATFEELSFGSIYKDLLENLFTRVPSNIVGYVRGLFSILNDEKWPYAREIARVRYLLTALFNGIDGETLGASLYELSLVPDFKLYSDLDMFNNRISRNLKCISELMNSHKSIRGRVKELNLVDPNMEKMLFNFFQKHDMQNFEDWTKSIAMDKQWWPVSFDKWQFKDELALDQVSIFDIETDLPVVPEDETEEQLAGLVGQQVLYSNERLKVKVTFSVSPPPTTIKGLDYFTVQIVSENDGPVGKVKKVKAGSARSAKVSVQITGIKKMTFEEGWHFIRVLPWTSNDDQLPLENAVPSIERKSNESDSFYVLPDGSAEEAPPQRAIPLEQSLMHYLFRLKLQAIGDARDPEDIKCTGITWTEKSKSRRSSLQDTLLLKYGRHGSVQIPVSSMLKQIEQRILSEPKRLASWRMNITNHEAHPPIPNKSDYQQTTSLQSFLAAREDLFQKIRGESSGIMQSFSFDSYQMECFTYGQAYLDLISSVLTRSESASETEKQLRMIEMRNLLSLDTIHVVLSDYKGRYREAILVSPTHPIRTLWLSCWTVIGQKWLSQLKSSHTENISAVRSSLLSELLPSNFPLGVPDDSGRIFINSADINAFWGLCAPVNRNEIGDEPADIRSLVSEISVSLGLPSPLRIGSDISGEVLSNKIERYLLQHPYVRELSLNVFNPGSGSLIVDALLFLQQKAEYKDMRYNIRLFSSDPEAPLLGEDLDTLIRPNDLVSESADAFAVTSSSHIFSKLNIAKHSILEFHNNVDKYSAHISLLLDVFPAEDLSVVECESGFAPLYGLIQDFGKKFIDDETGTFWSSIPIIGNPQSVDDNTADISLLPALSKHMCYGISAVATSGAIRNGVPVVTLGLGISERELIYEIHKVSDWVFTVDRNMGIEFYDHGGRKDRPDYLIDYVPVSSSQANNNLIISSRSTEELEAMLKPVFVTHELNASKAQAVEVLTSLRSLSGQLALKLISAPTQQSEALGLALARLYLDYQGALSNQMIIPLDSHTDLYRSKIQTDNNEGVSLQRTDLALFDLNYEARIITCNLVEVKCYSQVGGVAAYTQLKESISKQIYQSEGILKHHFDPDLKNPDRPDRLLKNRELAQILRFYLERAMRYEIFSPEVADEAKAFLDTIETGYSLQFRRSGLIFDFEKDGTNEPEYDYSIEFHRIGKDLIQALLDSCSSQTLSEGQEEAAFSQALSECFIPQIPKLDSAAFLAPDRPHSKSDFKDENIGLRNEVKPKPQENGLIGEEDGDYIATESEQPNVEPGFANANNTDISADGSAVDEDVDHPAEGEAPAIGSSQSEPAHGKIADKFKEEAKPEEVPYDVVLGVGDTSSQFGLIGEISGRKVALDLNHTNTISLFGVQGGGKSYTLGTVIEMATMAIPGINNLPKPLATVIFHYSPTQDYEPEFTSMTKPNMVEEEIQALRARYQANPDGLRDILILTPNDKLDERRAEFPDIEVQAISFSASELKAAHWKF